jgi:hypothetical protein
MWRGGDLLLVERLMMTRPEAAWAAVWIGR